MRFLKLVLVLYRFLKLFVNGKFSRNDDIGVFSLVSFFVNNLFFIDFYFIAICVDISDSFFGDRLKELHVLDELSLHVELIG